MKTLLVVGLATLGLVACRDQGAMPGQPGAYQGAENAPRERMEGPSTAGSRTVTGTVDQLSGDQLSILSAQEGAMDFQLDENVSVTENGQQASREAIGEGDQVRATFSEDPDGGKKLISLEVTGGAQQPGTTNP